jgi:hypothetical protein
MRIASKPRKHEPPEPNALFFVFFVLRGLQALGAWEPGAGPVLML